MGILKGVYLESCVGGLVSWVDIPDPRPGVLFVQAENFETLQIKVRNGFDIHNNGREKSGYWSMVKYEKKNEYYLAIFQDDLETIFTRFFNNVILERNVVQNEEYISFLLGSQYITIQTDVNKPELLAELFERIRLAMQSDSKVSDNITNILNLVFSGKRL